MLSALCHLQIKFGIIELCPGQCFKLCVSLLIVAFRKDNLCLKVTVSVNLLDGLCLLDFAQSFVETPSDSLHFLLE